MPTRRRVPKQTDEPQHDVWREHPLAEGGELAIAIGPLTLHCQRRGLEFWMTQRYSEDQYRAPVDRRADGAEPDWNRWALRQPATAVRLAPALPDRPVIVKPEAPFKLVPQAEARIYVRVPLWVQAEAIAADDRKVLELPTAILTKTWWGTFTGGEGAYWISSGARREMESDPQRRFMAICPMQIRNAAEEELAVEKLMLRVAGLGLYADPDGQIWASVSSIRYVGGVEFSQITVLPGAPDECRSAREIAPPRQPASRSLMGKTFGNLLEWAKWD